VIVTSGAVVGRVLEVAPHPNADRLWITQVDVGTAKLTIVHGGTRSLHPGDLVAVAPPGARLSTGKRMRTRRYRGQRSEGMLCSSDELGWTLGGPDAVHILTEGEPGFPLRTGGPAMADDPASRAVAWSLNVGRLSTHAAAGTARLTAGFPGVHVAASTTTNYEVGGGRSGNQHGGEDTGNVRSGGSDSGN
jgi:tRNA-binding EMAP/Myf-like protein